MKQLLAMFEILMTLKQYQLLILYFQLINISTEGGMESEAPVLSMYVFA
jgi:hypothetical protein